MAEIGITWFCRVDTFEGLIDNNFQGIACEIPEAVSGDVSVQRGEVREPVNDGLYGCCRVGVPRLSASVAVSKFAKAIEFE